MALFPWWLAGMIASASVIVVEFLNRRSDSFLSVLPWTLPWIILAQYCLWSNYNRAPHLLAAWIVFTIGTSACRLTMAKIALPEEPFSLAWALAGALLMVGASFCIKEALG